MREIDYGNLVEQAKKSNEQAITKLYEATYKNAYFTSYQILKDKHEAEDVLQECYIKAFQKLDMLKKQGSFPSWINRIVSNRSIDIYRKKKPLNFSQLTKEEEEDGKEIDFEDDKESYRPEIVADKKETARLLGEIIETLSDEQRIVVTMFYFQGMTVKEIAKDLEVSENTIKSRLNYGRKKIEKEVLTLEKKGTKLYGLAPIPFLLLLMETNAEAATVSSAVIGGVIAGTASTAGSVGVGTTGVAGGATTAVKAAGGAVVKKILVGSLIVGVTIGGGTFAYSKLKSENTTATKQEEKILDKKEVKVDLSNYKLQDYIKIVEGKDGRPDTMELNIDSPEANKINEKLSEKINRYYDESPKEEDSSGRSPGKIDAWLLDELGAGVMGTTGYVGMSESLVFQVDTNGYYDDIVTILIDFASIDKEEYKMNNGENIVYNIDINTGEILYLEDILEREGKTLEDVYNSGVYKAFDYKPIINRHMVYEDKIYEADDMAYKFTGEEMFILSKSPNFGNELLELKIIPSIEKNKVTRDSSKIASIQFNYQDISRDSKKFKNNDVNVSIVTDMIGARYSGKVNILGKTYNWEGDSFLKEDSNGEYKFEFEPSFSDYLKNIQINGEITNDIDEVIGYIKLLQYDEIREPEGEMSINVTVKDKIRASINLNSGENFTDIELKLEN